MKQFIGVFHHEFSMSIKRKGLWIGNAIVISFFLIAMFTPDTNDPGGFFDGSSNWQDAGDVTYMFNMLVPLIAGIMASDRMQRDYRLGLRELQTSTKLTNHAYLAGKYLGVLASTLIPFLVTILGLGIYAVTAGLSTFDLIPGMLFAFLVIPVPSFAFVVAFSLACPLFIPVRVYQILFTGYWFWGNFLNHEVFPTISGTVLNSSGIYPLQGFFAGSMSNTGDPLHTSSEALINIAVLFVCAWIALTFINFYLDRITRRA